MNNLLNPRWLFIINTLPILLLMLLFSGHYQIIKSLLSEENLLFWKQFGITLVVLGLMNAAYTVACILRKSAVSVWYAVLAFLLYIPFIWLYNTYFDQMIPSDIPRWMVPEETFLYVGTFLMPTLAYALFVLVEYFTPKEQEHAAWKNFLAALIIPLLWYIFTQAIMPLWSASNSEYAFHATLVLVIGSTILFLFFLLRGIYMISMRKAGAWSKYAWIWKMILALLFPYLGLAVNEGKIIAMGGEDHVFGDFSSVWFYILAIANGVLICLPNPENPRLRLLLFAGRSITLTYTFYFFLVMLPYLPLSIPAIVAFGAGFLMLTPLVLFVVQLHTLSDDFQALIRHFSKKMTLSCLLIGTVVLPAGITATYLNDKYVLHQALDYLYKPNYSKTYQPIDTTSLISTLEVVQKHKDRNSFFIFSNQTPYLSTWYNWLVLGNLTLSDSKIGRMRQVFLGKRDAFADLQPDNNPRDAVEISKISTNSRFDPKQQAWLSWIDLEITNQNNAMWAMEYATEFELPAGCWITDYYLYVGDRKEPGILSEKKAAMWVFSQIRNTNRDPGILYYKTGNRIGFQVFPFSKKEVRKTGIELIHREPIQFEIDGHQVVLGAEKEQPASFNASFTSQDRAYVSVKEKATLPKVQRKPYVHFMVDVSAGKLDSSASYIRRIESFLAQNKILKEEALVSFTGTYVHTEKLGTEWKNHLIQQPFSGGFYLERAIQTTLYSAHSAQNATYPVIVVVTDDLSNAIIEKDFSDFKMACPESDHFYELTEKDSLIAHSLSKNPKKRLETIDVLSLQQPVLAWPDAQHPKAYLVDNHQPDIVLENTLIAVPESVIAEKNWSSGLFLQGQWMAQVLHPEQADADWLTLVKYSFLSKIMTPVTSYIVVENDAQKAMLIKKQEQTLSGNKALDAGEDTQRMSEPDMMVLLLLLALTGWVFRRRPF